MGRPRSRLADREGRALSEAARYLRLLGLSARPPSLDALTELVRAQVTRVPFENVSKLHRRRAGLRTLPTLAEHLDGIERFHFGGTCYANNHHLHGLLRELGYDVRLCGADMSAPDVHLACVVMLDRRRFLVDAGYGAPFLAPLPLDREHDHVVALGRDRYVLHPRDAAGRSRLDLERDGVVRHGYTLTPAARDIAEFAGVIADSFRDDATFMNALVVSRFFPGRAVTLHDLTLMESEGDQCTVTPVPGRDALPALIEQRFDIPAAVAREALEGVELGRDVWG